MKTHDNGDPTMRKKTARDRPKTLQAITPNPSKIFTLTNQPPSDILRKCASSFGGRGGYADPPVLEDTPFNILSRNTKLKAYLVRQKGNFGALLKDLICYIIEQGGLIATNDPQRKYVMDRDRFHKLSLVASRGISSLSDYNRQERLYEILGLASTDSPSDAAPAENLDDTNQEEDDITAVSSAITAQEIRGYVNLLATDGLNGLIAAYPELADLPGLLGLLAVHSAKGREDDLEEVLGDVVRLVHAFRDRIDADALDVIEAFKPDAPAPKADQITAQQVEIQIRLLQGEKTRLTPLLQRISALKLAEDKRLETLEFTIIEQDLQERLSAAKRSPATSKDVPILEAALDRAEAKAEELRNHIDELGDILSPIKAAIDKINRRITALTLLGQVFQATTFEEPTLPPAPEFDVDHLLDWRTAVPDETPEPDAPQDDEEGNPEASSDEKKGKITTSSSSSGTLPDIEVTEDFVLALFRMLGQRTSLRIGNTLIKLGLIQQREISLIFTTAKNLSDRGRETRNLMYMGAFHGQATYRTAKHVPRMIVNEFIPLKIQRAILDEFEMDEPKP